MPSHLQHAHLEHWDWQKNTVPDSTTFHNILVNSSKLNKSGKQKCSVVFAEESRFSRRDLSLEMLLHSSHHIIITFQMITKTIQKTLCRTVKWKTKDDFLCSSRWIKQVKTCIKQNITKHLFGIQLFRWGN